MGSGPGPCNPRRGHRWRQDCAAARSAGAQHACAPRGTVCFFASGSSDLRSRQGPAYLCTTPIRQPTATMPTTTAAKTSSSQPTCSPKRRAAAARATNGCSSWIWPTLAMPPMASLLVPGKKAQKHAEHRDVEEPGPGGRRRLPVGRPGKQQQRRQDGGRREYQGPANHLPAADAAGPERVGHGRRDGRGRQQEIGPLQSTGTAAAHESVKKRTAGAGHGARPKPDRGTLSRR